MCQPTEIIASAPFARNITDLRKSYPAVDAVVCEALQKEILADPLCGDALKGYAGRVRKSRIANPDSSRGKRGGFRLLYDWDPESRRLVLLLLWSKSQQEDVPTKLITAARRRAELI